MKLQCEMTNDCDRPVTMIGDRGFIYCQPCGLDRRGYEHTRQLRPHELRRLERGQTIERY